MEKRYGSPMRQDGLFRVGRNKWDLFYGFGKDNEEDSTGWNWYQRFKYRPTLDEIKSVITQVIEKESASKLRYGLVWNDKPIEYTEERKTDLTGLLVAVQSGIQAFPITLNLGRYPDESPVFHVFNDVEELTSLAGAISAHKISVTNDEWTEKQTVDWSAYENDY